jgi:hypothetical protein
VAPPTSGRHGQQSHTGITAGEGPKASQKGQPLPAADRQGQKREVLRFSLGTEVPMAALPLGCLGGSQVLNFRDLSPVQATTALVSCATPWGERRRPSSQRPVSRKAVRAPSREGFMSLGRQPLKRST